MQNRKRRISVAQYTLLGVMMLGVAACDETTGPDTPSDGARAPEMLASFWVPGEDGLEFGGAARAPGDFGSEQLSAAEAWAQATLTVPEIESIRETLEWGSPLLQKNAQKKSGKGKGKSSRRKVTFGDEGGNLADRTETFTADGHTVTLVYSHTKKRGSRPPSAVLMYVDGTLTMMMETKWEKKGGEWTQQKVTTTTFDDHGFVTSVTVLGEKELAKVSALGVGSRLDRLACWVGDVLAPTPLHAMVSCNLAALQGDLDDANWTYMATWTAYLLAVGSCATPLISVCGATVAAAGVVMLAALNARNTAKDRYDACGDEAGEVGASGDGGGFGEEIQEPTCYRVELWQNDGAGWYIVNAWTVC